MLYKGSVIGGASCSLMAPPLHRIQQMLYKGFVIGGASCSLMAPPLYRIQQMLYEEKKKAPLKKEGG